MAQLLVRKLEEAVVKRLRLQAAREGVSVEEEHRRILRDALSPRRSGSKKSFKELLASMPYELTARELRRSKDMPREIDF